MALSRHDLLKGRFDHVRAFFNEILPRLTPELLDWAPAEGMRTVSGQLMEIIGVEMALVPRLKEGKEYSYNEIDEMIGDPNSLENLLNQLEETRRVTLEYLDSLSESDLEEEVASGKQWFGTFWKPVMPRAEHFLNISEHEFYHVGQLTVYLWMRGEDPYSW